MSKELTVEQRNDLRDSLGEAIHTAFRKASDHPEAHKAWTAIDNLPPKQWGYIMDFIMECV